MSIRGCVSRDLSFVKDMAEMDDCTKRKQLVSISQRTVSRKDP